MKMCDCNQGRLPCTCKPAEQHQGEPVALPDRKSYEGSFSAHGKGQIMGWNACLDEIAKLGPLYTHADAGEVERLRSENEALACNLRGKHELTGATYQHLVQERDTLRAQLAERNALLRECLVLAKRSVKSLWSQGIVDRAEAALERKP
jgi:hypothetical protein